MSHSNTPSKIIHYIPAKAHKASQKAQPQKLLRVAAYARVSTGSEEQQTSFKNQVYYYTNFIKKHQNWQFIRIYSDEGISGLSTKRRKGFNQMIQDAENGQIDLIITKSISRFARNILDAISTIRHLKSLGVDIFFERENLHTLDEKSEFILTLLSSLAQEESRNISENITWGIQKAMAKGRIRLPYKNFLGYKKGPNDIPEIIPEEAKIVQRIFKQFLNGSSIRQIARDLEKDQIKTPGRKTTWQPSTIASILRNEKYKGDALLQKVYTVDFLTHTVRPNTGQLPQYYIEHSHPPIVSLETYEKAQNILKLRSKPSPKPPKYAKIDINN